MSTTGYLINEEMANADPDVLLTPGTGESWWFQEMWAAGVNDDLPDVAFQVEIITGPEIVVDYNLTEAGVDGSTSHKHFISKYQQSAAQGWTMRCLPDVCVPDGCRIRLSINTLLSGDFWLLHGIAAIIDSTDEVSHAEIWADTDPDTILQPAANQMIRWTIWFCASSHNNRAFDVTLRRQVTPFEPIWSDLDSFDGMKGGGTNREYAAFKVVDGVTAIPDNEMPMWIPEGYEVLLEENLFDTDEFHAILLIGREYSAA